VAGKKARTPRRWVSPAPADLPNLEMTMEVRVYRAVPGGKEPPKGAAQALWDFLLHTAGGR
jgi:LysR family transcriptional regulator, hypochlorite-specific transcription factor HypT